MRILAITVMESWGGGEQVLYDIVKSIREHQFIVASPNKDFYKRFNDENSKLVAINSLRKVYSGNNGWSFASKILILLRLIMASSKLISVIKREPVDFVLANGNFAALFAFALHKIKKMNFIIIQHNILSKPSSEKKIISFLTKYSKKIVCVSNSVAENIISITNDNQHEKIVVIYNGVQVPEETLLKSGVKEEITIGIVGSILRWKGIDNIIKILTPLILKTENVYISIIGSTTEDPDSVKLLDELKEYISNNSLDNKIKFLGGLKNKSEIYSRLDILINYSRDPEAFSLTVAEAMSHSKIVIAKNIGGPKELIENDVSGFLCDPNNPEELLLRTEYCITHINKNNFQQIRTNARLRIENKFSLNIFKEKYEKLFQEVY